MKFKSGYIEIQADKLLYWYSKLTGTNGNAKAAAFYPFIFVTNKIHPKLRDAFINHELIHFEQQKEMLIIGQWILSLGETIYYRLFKGKSALEKYVLGSVEQEAYDNMFDLNYLKNRRHFAHIRRYMRNKPVSWTSLMINNFKGEGFPIVYEWNDKPSTIYSPHKHLGRVSMFIVDGSVTFSGSIGKSISKRMRFDVPVGVEHSAIAGPMGCRYVVAQEIEGDA